MENRIRELRKSRGLTMRELGAHFGLAESTISQYETGKRQPDNETLLKLAEFFGVSVDYLLMRTYSKFNRLEISPIRIPVLGAIPAGIPLEAIEDIVDWEELPSEMGNGGKQYFGLRVKGDSMYPDYLDGDTVIVRKTPVCSSGDVCVVYVNGYDATLKQVKFGENGSLTILPRNPEYAPRTFTPEEVESLPVSIGGVVVELRRKV